MAGGDRGRGRDGAGSGVRHLRRWETGRDGAAADRDHGHDARDRRRGRGEAEAESVRAPARPDRRPRYRIGEASRGLPDEEGVEAESEQEEEGSLASFEFAMRAYPLADISPALGTAARRTVARAVRTQRATARATAARWTSLGPAGISGELTGIAPSNGGVVSGRVTALAVVPGCRRARCTVYLGAAGGGLWKTTRGLAARPVWTSLWDSMPTQAVGSIAIDPRNPRVVYVGSGEPNGSNDSEAGLGLFVSRDAGATWKRLAAAPFDGLAIATLAIDPRRPRVLYAGAAYARRGASGVWGGRVFPPGTRPAGVYRSTNGGRTWRLQLRRPATDPFRFGGGVTRIRLDPVRPQIVYAAVLGHGLYRSRDSWGAVDADPHRARRRRRLAPADRIRYRPLAPELALRLPRFRWRHGCRWAVRHHRRTRPGALRPANLDGPAPARIRRCRAVLRPVHVRPRGAGRPQARERRLRRRLGRLRRCLRIVDDAALRVERPGRRTLAGTPGGPSRT